MEIQCTATQKSLKAKISDMVLLSMQVIVSFSKLSWKNWKIWGDTKSMRTIQKEKKLGFFFMGLHSI